MHTTITINFDHDDEDTLRAVHAILNNSLPFMVDNVSISTTTEA